MDRMSGPKELTGPARLALAVARADLGYASAALADGHVPRALALFPHGVLVAFEARKFMTQQLQLQLPDLKWDVDLAAAARLSNKYFDDNKRSIEQLNVDIGDFVERTRVEFASGWRRRLARTLSIFVPDLSILTVDSVPLLTNVSAAFHLGGRICGPDSSAATGRAVHDLAYGLGQMAAQLNDSAGAHRAPGGDRKWQWWDGISLDCYAHAFGGQGGGATPLLLLLQGGLETAATLTETDCCSECSVAAFKHRLTVAHHTARSLTKLRDANVIDGSAAKRISKMAQTAEDSGLIELRSLRNGLVHLGMTDVPEELFESEDSLSAVCRHYSGMNVPDIDDLVRSSINALRAEMTDWLLAAPPSGGGLLSVLRPPEPD